MIEKDFVTEGLRRTTIDEYLENELERAGYGGMEIQVTPLGTMVVVYAERPGMVIGRGGKTVRNITQNLKNNFGIENPQVEVKEVDVPELNPKIMAYKIANMLQRGMHFRRVAYTALRRIMGAGAQGVEVTISGKIRGARSACAKFTDGYIKRCGEPSTRFVREGFATVQLKPGVLGIYVRIMPPDVILPDKVDILKPDIKEKSVDQVLDTIETDESELEDIDAVEETAEKLVEDVKKAAKEVAEDIQDVVDVEKAEKDMESESDEKDVEAVKEAVEDVKKVAEKVAEDVEKSAKKAAEDVKKVVKEVADKAEDTVEAIIEEISEEKDSKEKQSKDVETDSTEAKDDSTKDDAEENSDKTE
ncbi:MAG: hypothetical protein Kow0019_08230 [Methanobacteriaceae archaeon]